MKRILILLTASFFSFSQSEASHWYFGNGAGLIFDPNTGSVTSTNAANSTINTSEGCSSISDFNGNLLFYTDGRNVWDKNHNVMPNANYSAGTGLMGDPSSTSSGLIIPKPGNINQYYVFTVDEPHHQNAFAYPDQGPADISGNPLNSYDSGGGVPDADDGFNNGLAYTLIDLALNSGNGDAVVTEKNIQLLTYDPNEQIQDSYKCSEKITAVEHSNGESYWVVTHFTDKFYAFRVESTGVNPVPVITSITPFITELGYRRNAIGYMKASPDGTKIAVCHRQNGNIQGGNSSNTGSVWLYDFDNQTGAISNPLNIYPNSGPYGLEFSPESSKLYVSNGNNVIQFDLESTNPVTSSNNVYNGFDFIGALQLGPDGKIYVANTVNPFTLDAINYPEEYGDLCDYSENAIDLAPGTSSVIGLPPFIQSFFLASIAIENRCLGDETQFSINTTQNIDGIIWDFGDSTTSGNSTELNPIYTYSSPGTYTVSAEITSGNETNIFFQTIVINDKPVINQPSKLEICDGNQDGIYSFNFEDTDLEILGSQDPENYTISYHSSLFDAEENINPLTIPYENSQLNETIFVRMENIFNSNCYDVSQFDIEVFLSPIAHDISEYNTCDDSTDGSDNNGQKEIDLTEFVLDILNNQDSDLFDVKFYLSQSDADNDFNEINYPYYNTNPFSYNVFTRVENSLYPQCYDTSEFVVNINPKPNAPNTDLVQCDDDGISDGFTVFNLTEANENITTGEDNLSTKFFISLEDANNNQNEISDPSSFVNLSNPQIIYAQIINDNTGCFNIAQLNLQVSLTSGADTILAKCDDDGNEDGFYSFNLNASANEILYGLPSDYYLEFYQTYSNALIEENPLPENFTNTEAYSQTIYARIENNNQCYGINELTLIVNRLPQLEQTEETFLCIGSDSEPVFISSGVIGNTADYSYQWSNGENTEQIQINQAGIYTLTVTNDNNCSKTKSITIINSDIATIETIDIQDASQNNTVTIFASGEGDYEYSLDSELGPYQDENIFFNVQPGFHEIYVRDKNNCGIVSELISVIGFPNFFTPNFDGYNDTWHVYGINTPEQSESEIYIFDRYGKLLKQLKNDSQGWDGTFNGNPMPSSDYWFYVKLNDNRIFRGHFSLKR